MVGVVTAHLVIFCPQPGQQIHGQQIHGVHQENPDKHGQGQGRHQLAAFGVVNDAFGLAVNHLQQYFNRRLEPPRHARVGHASSTPQNKTSDNAQQNGPKNRI